MLACIARSCQLLLHQHRQSGVMHSTCNAQGPHLLPQLAVFAVLGLSSRQHVVDLSPFELELTLQVLHLQDKSTYHGLIACQSTGEQGLNLR